MILEIKKRWALMLTLSVLISCGLFILREVKGEPVGEKLTVVTYNVGTLNGEKQALQSIVDAIGREGRPDLVLLQEVQGEKFLLQIAQGLGLAYHAFGAHGGNGLGILSRAGLVNPELQLLRPHGHAVLTAEMVVAQKRVLVCSVHLERVRSVKKNKEGFEFPWEQAFQILKTELTSNTPRSMAVEEILALSARRPSEEVIIGGDFNTVPFSTAIRAMGRHYDDVLRFTPIILPELTPWWRFP